MKNEELDNIAHKEFQNGELVEATYVINSSCGILQIFKPIDNKTVRYSTFFDGDHSIGETDGEEKEIKKLSRFEKDLLTLSERAFRRKYPKVQLYVNREKTRKLQELVEPYTD